MTAEYDTALGLDVGKSTHHGCALTPEGQRVYDHELPQDETALRKVFTDLQQHGAVLIVVDQSNTIGALPIAVDRDSDILSALKVLSGFDEDFTRESTRVINRLRSLLVQVHPSLERFLAGAVLSRAIVLELFSRYHGLAGLKAAGKAGVKPWARNHSRKGPGPLIDHMSAALTGQTITPPRRRSSRAGHPADRNTDQGAQTSAGHRCR
ncbi:hypothetical protein Bravens_00443 [Brevibacterium ravenspurgense]|uniref:Transposase IS110-like N-terminal domain-containing protein n=1 Tax=Brevibacterium ravenspurgense TaxID=479117 RepID=A0A150HAT7_9MICO|nr:hypothetical protein Bravens_00443 [Brevibacterium ravenspurgense]